MLALDFEQQRFRLMTALVQLLGEPAAFEVQRYLNMSSNKQIGAAERLAGRIAATIGAGTKDLQRATRKLAVEQGALHMLLRGLET